jgi:hypothetical protein
MGLDGGGLRGDLADAGELALERTGVVAVAEVDCRCVECVEVV